MRVGVCGLKNFGSYPSLDFDFSNLGLFLVAGETGSGKSTFMDAVAWILFGVTSKEGSADDIKAWDAHDPAAGRARVSFPDGEIEVYRSRGRVNDLFWHDVVDGIPVYHKMHRGKDLNETQKLLEKRMGVTSELFLLGSYMTQFSKADSFFIAKAKDRRDVLEKIADQEFAIKLGEKASEARKTVKKDVDSLQLKHSAAVGRRDSIKEHLFSLAQSSVKWLNEQALKIRSFEDKLASFEEDNQKTIETFTKKSSQWQTAQNTSIENLADDIEALSIPEDPLVYNQAIADTKKELAKLKNTRCESCGSLKASTQKEELNMQLHNLLSSERDNEELINKHKRFKLAYESTINITNPHQSGLEQAQKQTNPYGEQLKAAKTEYNPFVIKYLESKDSLNHAETQCDELETQIEEKETLVSSLTWLYDKSFELRGLMMARVVSQIESATNTYLEKYFDAALRVQFSLADSDKLDVEINNNGYPCPFKSLSGGERTMLKLAFSLSLMRAAQDKAGVSFDMIMLDEPFNGLSDALKVKAFGLLQQLESEYSSVLVIDHSSELKTQFDKSVLVDKSSGHSVLCELQNN